MASNVLGEITVKIDYESRFLEKVEEHFINIARFPPISEEARVKDKIVLHPSLDPDPFGYHGIPIKDRLIAMGWK